MNKPSFQQLLRNPIQLLAFGFGSGLSPKAPGTAGTVVAVPLFFLMAQLSLPIYSFIVVVAAAVGIYLCGKCSDQLDVPDHPGIVWDEFVGYWIAMWALPVTAVWMIAGFVIFRVLDIVKPWPISWCDRNIHGGWGIMLDDILAGVATCGLLHLLNYYLV